MNTSFYDVVLLGTELAPMLCGALLARRGFRVLVLGQDDVPPTYGLVGMTLPRAPFLFHPIAAPHVRRVLSELALAQAVRRYAQPVRPAFQSVLRGHRLDISDEEGVLSREAEREFPEVRRPVEDFHRDALRTSAQLDRILDRDVLWPPTGFFEKRELGRLQNTLPEGALNEGADPFREFPDEHPFRTVVRSAASFLDGMDPDLTTPLRVGRAWTGWTRGAAELPGGYAWLIGALKERIRAYGGDVRERDRAEAVLVKRGAITGLALSGSGDAVGCNFVVCGRDLGSLVRLLSDRRPLDDLFEQIGEPQARYYKYTLNVVIREEGLPAGMAANAIVVRETQARTAAENAPGNALWVQRGPRDVEGRRVLTVQTLLPRQGIEDLPHFMDRVRERTFAALGGLIPFLGRHALWVDSPHDGRPAQDIQGGAWIAAEEPWTRGPQAMQAIYGFPVTTGLGVCAVPVQTPIRHLLLCNHQVVPGLGTEGLFLAAASAARVITRSDRQKEKLRRGLWTKLEL